MNKKEALDKKIDIFLSLKDDLSNIDEVFGKEENKDITEDILNLSNDSKDDETLELTK